MIVAAKYESASSESLGKPSLYPALAKLIQTHAALGVYVKLESSSKSSYHRLQTVDLDQVVTFVDDEDVAIVMERQFLLQLDMKGTVPLWRLIVLADNTVLFAFHHAIGDGKSGAVFHAALIKALNDLSLSQDSSAHVTVPMLELVPPVEAVVDVSVSFGKFMHELASLLIPASWTQAHTAWTGNPVITSPDLRTNVRIIRFSPEESLQFLEACRANKSTVTSAFHTIACSTLSRLVAADTSTTGRYKTVPSTIPISLRGLGNISPDVLCDHISACYIHYPLDNTQFSWPAATTVAATLKSQLTTCPENIGIIKFLFGNEQGFIKGMEGNKRNVGMELSNIGKFTGSAEPEDKWSISQVVFAQCDPVGGAALKLNVAGDPMGGVSCTVTWGEGAIEGHFVASFISEFRKEYHELIGVR